jgi:hypothetical protein
VLHHLLGDDVLFLPIWWSLQEIWLWKFGGKSQRSKRVHDQIHPKELDGLKWRLPHDDGSDKGNDQSNNIDSQLELKESSNVVVYISAPLAGCDNGSKVIILDNDISG